MSAALIAFITEALTLFPLIEKAYGTLAPIVTHLISVLTSGEAPTPADVTQLATIRADAMKILDQRAADAKVALGE